MRIQDWAALTVSILTIIAVVAGSIKWLVKHYLAELKPNGGGSVKDQVNRLEMRMAEAEAMRQDMNHKIDKMYEVLLDYISKK